MSVRQATPYRDQRITPPLCLCGCGRRATVRKWPKRGQSYWLEYLRGHKGAVTPAIRGANMKALCEQRLNATEAVCNHCHELKPAKEFRVRKKHGGLSRLGECRSCEQTKNKKYSRKKYEGMTLERFEELSAAQDNLCELCGKPDQRYHGTLSVDHDHVTGKTRGLLCSQCNIGLGAFKDSVEVMRAAVEYLERHDDR